MVAEKKHKVISARTKVIGCYYYGYRYISRVYLAYSTKTTTTTTNNNKQRHRHIMAETATGGDEKLPTGSVTGKNIKEIFLVLDIASIDRSYVQGDLKSVEIINISAIDLSPLSFLSADNKATAQISN